MRAQIEYEMEREVKSYADIFKLFRHRALVCIAVQTMTSLTGVNVIQYYQTILFESLGIGSHMILALAGIYGTIALSTNLMTTIFVTDRWGRRPMILTGLTAVICIEIYAAIMQMKFQNTDNTVGKAFCSTRYELLPLSTKPFIECRLFTKAYICSARFIMDCSIARPGYMAPK